MNLRDLQVKYLPGSDDEWKLMTRDIENITDDCRKLQYYLLEDLYQNVRNENNTKIGKDKLILLEKIKMIGFINYIMHKYMINHLELLDDLYHLG